MRRYALLFLAAMVSWLPMQLFQLGGDSTFQQIYIDCFAGQFWQGDWFPHWCMEINAGSGAPMLYPPLGYYIATLIYPITWLGFSLYDVLSIGVLLSTIAAAVTCYLWLRENVTPQRALLAAVLFLFLPYNAEVKLFRVAYAEGWAIAIMPMIFLYLQRLVRGDQTAAYRLVLWASFGILCSLPVMAVAVVICGLYVLVVGKARLDIVKKMACLGIAALLLTSFYLIPAAYYKQFTYAHLMKIRTDQMLPYANSFLDLSGWDSGYFSSYPQLTLGIVFTPLALGVLTWLLARRRDALKKHKLFADYKAWVYIWVFCLFLSLPISAPLYALLGPVEQIVFPWRMQIGAMFALVWLIAVWMQYCAVKTQKLGDYASALLLLVLLYGLGIGIAVDDTQAKIEIASHTIRSPEYRTLWMDVSGYKNLSHIPVADRVAIIKGRGKTEIKEWNSRLIQISVSMKEGGQLRLKHHYFPTWRANIPLMPEAHTGWMLIDVPAGEHIVTLRNSLFSPF